MIKANIVENGRNVKRLLVDGIHRVWFQKSLRDVPRPLITLAVFLAAAIPAAPSVVQHHRLLAKLPAKLTRTSNLQLRSSTYHIPSDSGAFDSSVPDKVPGGSIRYCGRAMYDGAYFKGWQLQPHDRTVQGEIEAVLALVTQSFVRVNGASRTDTGVHALGQCFHFDMPCKDGTRNPKYSPAEIEKKFNRLLPDALRVYNVSIAPKRGTVEGLPWHSRVASQSKLYTYHFTTTQIQSPLRRHAQVHYTRGKNYYFGELNISRLRELMPVFVGTHNFSAFVNRDRGASVEYLASINPVRTILDLELCADGGPGEWRFEVTLDGALYKMVRNIVGILWALGAGVITSSDVASMLANGRLASSVGRGYTAPANGLTLTKVHYEDYD